MSETIIKKGGATAADLQADVAELKAAIARLDQQLIEARKQPAAKQIFSAEDASFLVWTMGFVAGANLERDGERGERIFARCRDLHNKLESSLTARPTAGGNPS
jgi:hypothetical protein